MDDRTRAALITNLLITFSQDFPINESTGHLAVELLANGMVNDDTTLTDYGRTVMDIVLKAAGYVLADNGLMKGDKYAGECRWRLDQSGPCDKPRG